MTIYMEANCLMFERVFVVLPLFISQSLFPLLFVEKCLFLLSSTKQFHLINVKLLCPFSDKLSNFKHIRFKNYVHQDKSNQYHFDNCTMQHSKDWKSFDTLSWFQLFTTMPFKLFKLYQSRDRGEALELLVDIKIWILIFMLCSVGRLFNSRRVDRTTYRVQKFGLVKRKDVFSQIKVLWKNSWNAI